MADQLEEIEEKALEQEAMVKALRRRGKESQETTVDIAESPVGDGSHETCRNGLFGEYSGVITTGESEGSEE